MDFTAIVMRIWKQDGRVETLARFSNSSLADFFCDALAKDTPEIQESVLLMVCENENFVKTYSYAKEA